MFIRSYGLALIVAGLVAVGGGGCKKSKSGETNAQETRGPAQAAMPSASQPSVSRLHWLGKKRLGAETNAACFMSIWNLPESARLEAQTLDKLALARWRAQFTNDFGSVTNYQPLVTDHPLASRLRPLLQDVVEQESYLEIRQAGTNEPGELAFAIRLDNERATLWDTNLAAVAEALTGSQAARDQANGLLWQIQFASRIPASSGPSSTLNPPSSQPLAVALTNHASRITDPDPDSRFTNHASRTLALIRSGDWTILGLACGANGTNGLARELAKRIQSHPRGTPLTADGTNFWVEADFDLRQAFSALGLPWRLPANWPRVLLTAIGDGENVRTRAELDFPQPLQIELEPWNIPTNIIHDPLIGFSAIRSIRPLLKAFRPWNDLHLGTPPNQAFFWAQQGAPWLHFMAAPSTEATNQVSLLEEYVVRELNPKFESNHMGELRKEDVSQRLVWKGIPVFSPTMDCVYSGSAPFVFAGFFPNRLTNQPPPPELLHQLFGSANLVCYDWEITGPCLQGLTPMAQLVRHSFGKPRLPPEPAIGWLLALSSRLANSGTTIHATGPTKLSIARNSSFGFTAAELELLVDWMESGRFPIGLHTFGGSEIASPKALGKGGLRQSLAY